MPIGISVNEIEGADTPAVVPAGLGRSLLAFEAPRGVPNKPYQLTSAKSIKDIFCPQDFNANTVGPLVMRSIIRNAGEGGVVTYGMRIVSSANPPVASTLTVQEGLDDVWKFTAGRLGEADPGSWSANLVGVKIVAGTTSPSTARNIEVYWRDTPTSAWVLKATYYDAVAGLGGNGVLMLNHGSLGDQFVMAEVLDAEKIPDVMASPTALTGGTDASGATPASVTGTIASPFQLDNGDVLNILLNGGVDEDLTFAAAAASVTAGNSETFDFSAGGETLTVTVGTIEYTITFQTADFSVPSAGTSVEVCAVINSAIGHAHAEDNSGSPMLVTDKQGTAATLQVSATGDAQTILAFQTSLASGTGDAADIDEISITEINAKIQANVTLAGLVAAESSLGYIKLVTTATGPTATVQVGTACSARAKLGLDDTVHSGGTATSATPSDDDYGSALSEAVLALDVQIIAAADRQSYSWGVTLEGVASTSGVVAAILAAEDNLTDAGLASTYSGLLKAKSFLAGYTGWVKVGLPDGGTTWIPPVGHVIGAGYVKKVRAKGNLPHIAPAGVLSSFSDALDVRNGLYDQSRLTDVVATAGFNPVVFEKGNGIFVKTSRTFSSQQKWYSVHVRVLTNYCKVAFRRSFSILEQEGNDDITRDRLRRSIDRFMGGPKGQSGLYAKGAFETAGGYANNVSVVCDRSNNSMPDIRARKLKCDVTYRPVEIAEDIEINMIMTSDGIVDTEN